ncbi:MAG: tetratricopeptide repeat protein [Muribaculaceae bacterium]
MKRFITIVFAMLLMAGNANLITAQTSKTTRTATSQTRRAHQKVVPATKVSDADKGKSDAELGKKYFESENYGKAIGYVKKAAAAGDLDSQVRLADMTFFGNEVEMDREAAHNMVDKAIEKGSAYGMERKGFYLICEGMKQEGFEWFKKAAEAGNCDASVYVMNCYRTGDFEITQPDAEQAAKYCRLAAEQGSMEGQAFYGLYQIKGEAGVEKDETAGIELIEKAYKKSQRNSFEKNCPEAAKALADHYSKAGNATDANAINAALKKYHPDKY